MDSTRILLFLKAPVKGMVKTRLALTLGEDNALCLYRAFVLDILDKIKSFKNLILYFTPPEHEPALRELVGRDLPGCLQKGVDLGEKMARAFEEQFGQGAQKVLLMGTDVPDIPVGIIEKAVSALEDHPAVIAPSQDGGYFLIGFTNRGYSRKVFEQIPWSTPQVCEKTLEIMRENRIECHVLPSWADVDTGEDFSALTERLRSKQTRAPHTWAWITRHETGSIHHHSGTE